MGPRGRMANTLLKIAIAALLCLWHSAATAFDYKCVVRYAYNLSHDGDLKLTDWAKMYLGGEFVIDRATGRMIGVLANHNANGEPKVLDPGSPSQAYKVITVYKPLITVDYLVVQEFLNQPRKPFFFVSGFTMTVVSGQCTYF